MSTPFDTDVTDLLLTTTRAVRKRLDLDRPVEREVILDCLRLAVQAPTGSNSQGWRWMVVTDEAKRAALADLYRRSGLAYMKLAEEHMKQAGPDAMTPKSRKIWESSNYLLDNIQKVPALVIPCIEGRITDVGHAAGFFGSILPAAWSFQLALRSRGLGSVWTTFHLSYEKDAAELLGIPYEKVTQAAMLPVAYTKGTDFKPAERGPIEDITFWNQWSG